MATLKNIQYFSLVEERVIVDCSLLNQAIKKESSLYNIPNVNFWKSTLLANSIFANLNNFLIS
uniref:Uncharacterized protein n=1 Tax=Physcomitrium patens TaxID=3218 RepID=A0A2K1IJR8_PHYPA|nr:hypothetical protein PHYPA_028218 [Physcomitrium patens]